MTTTNPSMLPSKASDRFNVAVDEGRTVISFGHLMPDGTDAYWERIILSSGNARTLAMTIVEALMKAAEPPEKPAEPPAPAGTAAPAEMNGQRRIVASKTSIGGEIQTLKRADCMLGPCPTPATCDEAGRCVAAIA